MTDKSAIQNLVKNLKGKIKRHGKFFLLSFISLSVLFGLCFYMKDYMKLQKSAEMSTKEFITEWTSGDTDALAERFDTDKSYFEIKTGFDNNALTNIITDTTYQGTEMTIKDVDIHIGIGEEKTTAKARILVQTYDNMAILKKLFNNIINDKSAVTHNYNEKALINKHIVALERELKDYSKDFQDVQVFTMTWDDKSDSWNWESEGNYEGINSVSGNMFEYMKGIGVSE